MKRDWGTDTPISLPKSSGNKPLVELGAGFAFTAKGLTLNVTEEERDEHYHPFFLPGGPDVG